MEASIVRIAFGAVLLSGAQSKEHAYETLDWLLDSVQVNPQQMRDLIFRVNWPLMSGVIPELELNRITTWMAVVRRQGVIQIVEDRSSLTSAPPIHGVQLEIDNNTVAGRELPFERAQRVPIFRELVSLARQNAEAGERP